MAPRLPQLHVSNQKAYVWNVSDIQTLRVEHHICGILSGTLPQVSQQNTFLGLPLVLLPEEVVLLLKHKLAVIVSDNDAHLPPSVSDVQSYHSSRAAAISTQQHLTLDNELRKRSLASEKFKSQIESRQLEKGAKGDKAKDQDAAFEVFVPSLSDGEKTTGPPPSLLINNGKGKGKARIEDVAYTIVIQPTSEDLPWFDPSAATFRTLESAKDAGVWNYPDTKLQEARCEVFEDLWRTGHYMGGGLRFGGDFLIYPGDPLRYHSHFTLTVLPSPSTPILPLDLVAYGRLATGVKKAHLLGTWDEKARKVDFFSLEWAAFG
ncbi:hypothetical protein RQP46_006672 [Phenoliferia psychrophenolica]